MSTKNLKKRRDAVAKMMDAGSVMILYSGKEVHVSEDEYYMFEVNKNFRYLTDIDRDNMVLFIDKTGKKVTETLFIEEADPLMEKWYGKKLTKDEAKEISGIEDVRFIDSFDNMLARMLTTCCIKNAYFDLYHHDASDELDFNHKRAMEFHKKNPAVVLKNAYEIIGYLRMSKDADEVKRISHAVDMTRQGLEAVMKELKPGMYEYQAQAIYEYTIHYLGSSGPSFPTIAGSGYNGTMLHYETNRCECKDGDLLLLDLGSKADGWCSDITRTYPVNGKFTKRQKDVYNVVLEANQHIAKIAKPGMTLRELNDECKKVLAKGAKKLGLIKEDSELSKYYMHGVGHHLGLDVHDASTYEGVKLRPGCVITDEPGLYIDEECIGIRIEDDLLITEDGCKVLSKDIIRKPDEIEAFMAKNKKGKK
ncbi:MAG: aminopeptidase P N-terminal domain-containing protein [Lachnospiraceae bacterium]|nr:aminopeptidase P N-terminal domain-containing protein [Lachnospiraceae bacterium]